MPEERAQRTEEPTPRRKQKAREEGQVAASRELTTAIEFALAVGLLMQFGPEIVDQLRRVTIGLLRMAFETDLTTAGLTRTIFALAAGPVSFWWKLNGALLAVGLLVHLSQTGFALSAKRLTPDVNRLNPAQKLREMPGDNLAQTAKALVLLPLAAWVFWAVVGAELENFLALPSVGLAAGLAVLANALLALLSKAALALVALGVFDFWRQRRKLNKRLMMTKQEIKQEHKDMEGSPQVKARRRRMQREMMRRRMMSDVPKATVVVTNPTHYAVALRYEPEKTPAPMVTAKGLDFLALRIRETAEKHGVAIVENPPLAQALYKGTEIGQEIPAEMYRAVAEILAYIFQLRR